MAVISFSFTTLYKKKRLLNSMVNILPSFLHSNVCPFSHLKMSNYSAQDTVLTLPNHGHLQMVVALK